MSPTQLAVVLVDRSIDGGQGFALDRPLGAWIHLQLFVSFAGNGTRLRINNVDVGTPLSGLTGVTAGYFISIGAIPTHTQSPGRIIYDNIVVRPAP